MYRKWQSRINAFNRALAVWITSAVGTMACAYLFTLLAILGFPPHGSPPNAYVQWISQTLIQLTMLSIIMVGQRVMEEKHQQRHTEHLSKLDAHHDAQSARLDALEAHVKGKRLIKKVSKKGPTNG